MPTSFTAITDRQLLGLDCAHLVEVPEWGCRLHPALQTPLRALAAAAAREGFALGVASGYRSFERQLSIWNAKARGERPVVDDEGRPLDVATLADQDKALAILRWSALPGTSRHHWGSDLDVYDRSRMPADYRLQLSLAECRDGGCCAEFHQWLSGQLATGQWDFYRPYDRDRGGVSPEPWHLSFRPLARELAPRLTPALVRQQLQHSDLELKTVVLANLEVWMERFVTLPGEREL